MFTVLAGIRSGPFVVGAVCVNIWLSPLNASVLAQAVAVTAQASTAEQESVPTEFAQKVIEHLPPFATRAQLLCVRVDGGVDAASEATATRAFLVVRCERGETGACTRVHFGPLLLNASCLEGEGVTPKISVTDAASLLSLPYRTGDLGAGANAVARLELNVASFGVPTSLAMDELTRLLENATCLTFDPFAEFGSALRRTTTRTNATFAVDPATIEQSRARRQQIIDESSDLYALGESLLREARRVAAARELGVDAPAAIDATVIAQPALVAPLLPTPDPLGFVAWCVAVDGEQALLRARGEIASADRRVRDLRASLKAMHADVDMLHLDQRVPHGSVGFRSFVFVQQFPIEAWSIGCAVASALDRRHLAVEELLKRALSIGKSSDLSEEAIAELIARIRQMEESLPPGFTLSAEFVNAMEAHLWKRFDPTKRQGIDIVQARTAVLELYAAAWNLSGVLPEQVRDERLQQRSICAAQVMDAFASEFARVPQLALAHELRSALEAELNSPFQACLLYPENSRDFNRVKAVLEEDLLQQTDNVESFFRDDMVFDPEVLADPEFTVMRDFVRPKYLQRFRQLVSHSVMASIVGEMMAHVDRGVAANSRAPRANPFFRDCNLYWSTRDDQPPFPRLTLKK
ncbi:MAG: hypothetical protein EXS10_03600 [Phycisphaerales bacterium]|nr:hypothetical protein [Phycisphaerales bacterium]